MDRQTLHSLLMRAGTKRIKATAEGFACVCPLHNGVRPTFNINAETGLWRCWNPACDRKGNFVLFLHLVCKMSYPDAVAYAADVPVVASLELSEWALPDYDKRMSTQDVPVLEEKIAALYSRCPTYMLERGFPKDFLRRYDIGFDSKGYEHEGRVIGANRVTFPVRDFRGRLLGFTRRAIDDGFPKYLHDVPKAVALYLIERTKKGCVLGVTEGPVDALRARYICEQLPLSMASGFDAFQNMTATLGAGLTVGQANLIAGMDPVRVVLANDNDDAGVQGTRKSIRMLRERGVSRIEVCVFPGHDLGDLDVDQHVDVDFVSTYRWLIQHSNKGL